MTDIETSQTSISFHVIGVIRTLFPRPRGTPIQPSRAGGAIATVEIFSPYRQGLKDLDGFDRIWLVYWMHQAPEGRLLVTPFLDKQKRGVFATRAPTRPNALGISSVRLLRIDGGAMVVTGADIVDGTPLLDVKPYVPEFDSFPGSRAGWLDNSRKKRRVADDRFSATPSKAGRPKR